MLLFDSNGCRPSSESVTNAVTNQGYETSLHWFSNPKGATKLFQGFAVGRGKASEKCLPLVRYSLEFRCIWY